MSNQEIDLEKGQTITNTTPLSPEIASPLSPNLSRPLSGLESYQLVVGDIEKPRDLHDLSLYHAIIAEQQKVHSWYIFSAVLIYTAIFAQVVLCLGIVVGTQRQWTLDTICYLAAINTAVAATIGVLKALGLPDKKAVEHKKLQRLAERIRLTTRKLRAGIIADANGDADAVRKDYELAQDEAVIEATTVSGAVGGGLSSFNSGLKSAKAKYGSD